MGILGKLFGKNQKHESIELLDSCVTLLRTSLFLRILPNYKDYEGKKPQLIAGAIMNYINCEKPTNEDARLFLEDNKSFIERETKKLLKGNPEIKSAVEMLLLTEMNLITISTGSVSTEHIIDLTSRAFDIGAEIPVMHDPGEIYGAIVAFVGEFCTESDAKIASFVRKEGRP